MNIQFPLILDGAFGTQLQKAGLPRGECPEKWVLENPDVAIRIQKAYVDAGSDVIYSPTFGANSTVLERHGIFNKVSEYNQNLVAISKKAAAGKALVASDLTSTGEMLYPVGSMSFEDLFEVYSEQAAALEKAGVDLFVVETMTAVPETRAAVLAIKSVSSKPVFVSFSCDANGKTMTGTDVCAALLIMEGLGVDAFGLNCSSGPAEMLEQIKRLRKYSSLPLIAKPNAGLPQTVNGETVYTVGPEEFASYIPALAEAGVNIFGACCGSDDRYIAAIKKTLKGLPMKAPDPCYTDLLPCATEKQAFMLPADEPVSCVLPCDGSLEDSLYELDEGALFAVEIKSIEDVAAFSDAQYAVRNPLCIICDDAVLLEKTLRAYQGRPLYEGAIADEELIPLAEKYGLII